MIYSDEEIERQLQLGKDSRWVFKQIEFRGDRPVSPSHSDLADEIAAFANADGGVLFCGARDEQDISLRRLTALDSVLVEIATNRIRPPVRIETHHRERSTGERFLLARIPRGDSQHDSPGGSFVRVGGSKRRMSSDERLRLAQKRSQGRYLWFDKQPWPNTGIRTLDESLWKPLLSAEGAAEPEIALEKLALLAPDESGVLRATAAGILLCTGSPERFLPNACITATCYRGRDRTSDQVDAREITGPLNQQIESAVAFAVRNMRVSAKKAPARAELPQYSDRALFEALVNAVAHRDYSIKGSKIRLSMFEDRMEIQSPGSLPNNLTLESMAERQSTRNEALTSVLGRMPVRGIQGSGDRLYFMERRGDGVPIIRRETRELSGKWPVFRLIDDSDVCLTIPAAAQQESPARAVVTTWAGGLPAPETDLLALFPNRTWQQAVTDADGEAILDLHTTHLPMTVFAAAPGRVAYVNQSWTPSEGALAIELEELHAGGSVIFPEASGHLPGLRGRLNPIRDNHGRTYLYASNIAINRGEPQPVSFLPGEELRLTDADGRELWVRIVSIVGRSSLVEYRSAPRS